jgi:thiol:disulfide interchange protein DsbA
MIKLMRKLVFLGILLTGLTAAVARDGASFQEGTHYQRLGTPVPTASADKIEVVELFWYGCPHCYTLEGVIDAWLKTKPDNVQFVRMPATLGRKVGEVHARAFYTAETLGVLDKIHEPLMEAIHAKKRRIDNEDQLAEFFAEQGVAAEEFRNTYESFNVETKFRRSQDLIKRYRVGSVPTVIVNGTYVVDATMAGSSEKLFEVVDYLIRREAGSS